ncbi:MAG: PilZ domain-containing protein [Phycisphaerales bacterium]|nr:PilZ domain-containing protein [Phycisphaerales bacterium]
MFDDPRHSIDAGSLDLLLELEQNTPDAVRRQRSHARFTVRSRIICQPGNASDRLTMKIQGVSGDLSAGGCQILFPVPLRVGDVYWLTFDREVIDLAPAFARCLRCRLVREDAFEAGFAFFTPLALPQQVKENELLS